MSAFEVNKFTGSFLAAALLACVAAILGETIYAEPPLPEIPTAIEEPPPAAPAAEGEAPAGPEAETAVAAVDAPPPEPPAEAAAQPDSLPARLAAADPVNGELQAKKCAVCHAFALGKTARLGPVLYGVIGREVASVRGYRYSDAMSSRGGAWDYQSLDGFIADPAGWVPETKMAFAGIPDAKVRADVIAWLRTLSDSPAPLPELPEAAPAGEGAPAEGEAPPGQEAPAEQ